MSAQLRAIAIGLGAAACWTASSPEPPPHPEVVDRPISSPGVVDVTIAASTSFKRAIATYATGDWESATILLDKVMQAESNDSGPVRAVAAYDLATILLEHGMYTAAAAIYDSVADRESTPPALLERVATGTGVIFERLDGKTELALDQVIGRIPEEVVAAASPTVKWQLRYLRVRMLQRNGHRDDARRLARELPAGTSFATMARHLLDDAGAIGGARYGDVIGLREKSLAERLANDWARVAYELRLTARLSPAWRSTAVAGEALQELELERSVLAGACEHSKARCAARPKWNPRTPPTPIGVVTLTFP